MPFANAKPNFVKADEKLRAFFSCAYAFNNNYEGLFSALFGPERVQKYGK